MYKIKGNIWVESESGAFIGNGRMLLLEKIKELGSITKAAKFMKMSYRQAWGLVSSMNKQSGKPLVTTAAGGAGGGGAVVTKEGEKAIATFKKLQEKFYKFNEEESRKLKF